MSALIGVSSKAYSNWESGLSEMRASDLKRISEILDVPMENILEGAQLSNAECLVPLNEKIEVNIEVPGKIKVHLSAPYPLNGDEIGKIINGIIIKQE